MALPETPPRIAQKPDLFSSAEGDPGTHADRRDLRRVPVKRARTSALPDWALASKERALASGASMPELFAKFDRATSSWKTYQLCLDGDLETFSEIWPRSGTMRNGVAYLPPKSVRRTSEIASGLLPTLTVVSCEHPGRIKLKSGQQTSLSMELSRLHGWKIGGQLSPTWTARFMGFPALWTAYVLSETPSSPKSPNSSDAP